MCERDTARPARFDVGVQVGDMLEVATFAN